MSVEVVKRKVIAEFEGGGSIVLLMWHDGSVTAAACAESAFASILCRDRTDAAAADTEGRAVVFATTIEWRNTPAGFEPPTVGDAVKAKARKPRKLAAPRVTRMYQTRGVLAGAYPRHSLKSALTHSVEIDDRQCAIRVLCNRVQLDNIADVYSPGDLNATPTCKTCERKLAKETSK